MGGFLPKSRPDPEDNCLYCLHIFGDESPERTRPWNSWLFETNSFVVVPSLGSFVPGWLLLVSKLHFRRIAELRLQLIEELENLKAKVGQELRSAFGPYVCFEHGPVGGVSAAGCCVEHLHLHMVPVSVDLNSRLILNFKPHRIQGFKDLLAPTFRSQPDLPPIFGPVIM